MTRKPSSSATTDAYPPRLGLRTCLHVFVRCVSASRRRSPSTAGRITMPARTELDVVWEPMKLTLIGAGDAGGVASLAERRRGDNVRGTRRDARAGRRASPQLRVPAPSLRDRAGSARG